MITEQVLRKLAMTLNEVTEEPHFEKTSFRIKKKIFLTYDKSNNLAVVKLTEAQQDIFKIASKGAISPVDNKWGKQGWTRIDLLKVDASLVEEVLIVSYQMVGGNK
jgi:hypothetical protein